MTENLNESMYLNFLFKFAVANMSDVLPWRSKVNRNYGWMMSVVDDILANELRKIFKREWNNCYKTKLWNDNSVSGGQLLNLKKSGSWPNKKTKEQFQHGNTNQWDCSVLVDAILLINSRSVSKIHSSLHDIREIRNSIKHKGSSTLSDADFQTMTTDVEKIFHDLGIPINDIEEIKAERNQFESFQVLPLKPNHPVVTRSDRIDQIVRDLESLRDKSGCELTYYYISGNPGSGKSQLSRQVCEHLFESVNWKLETAFVMTLNAKDTDALLKSYEDFCRRLNCCKSDLLDIMKSNESKEGKIERLRLLVTTRIRFWKKWWIIVDNVDDLAMIDPLLPQMNGKDWNNGQIILTVQNTTSVPAHSSSSQHISLSKGMKGQVSRQLLHLLSETDVNDPVLEEVVEKLDYQPLAMAAASVYFQKLKGTKFSWHDFIRKLEQGKRHIMDDNFAKINPAYPSSMSAAVGLAVKKSAENNFILKETFYFLSLNSFHSLPLDVIVQYIQQLNQVCGKEEIYLEIKDCSLFLIENKIRDVRLHRVVHEAIKMSCGCDHAQTDDNHQIRLPNKGTKVDVNSKVHYVVKALYCFKERDDKIKILPHLKAFIESVKKLFPEENSIYSVWSNFEKEEISRICMFFCETLKYYSELRLAVEFQNLIIRIWIWEKENPRMISSYEQLGSLFLELGEFEKAKEYYKCVLRLCQKFIGEKSFDVANAHFNLALAYFCEGKNEDAQKHFELVLEMAKEILNSGNLAPFYNALGAGYLKNGQVEEAKNCHEQALKTQQKDFCSNHDDVANTSSNRSIMFDNTGKPDATKHCLQQALENVKKQLGPSHVHVATTYYYLGTVFANKGDLDSAKDCHQQALEIREKQFGSSHVYVADSYNDLGKVYDKKDELDLAKDCLHQSLKIRKKQLGSNHLDVAISYNNLGGVYFKRHELDLAKDCHERALEIRKTILGPNHVDVANCYNNLGAVLCKKGELDLAKDCHRRALEIQEKQLSPKHVDVAISYNNLGAVYLEGNELDLAKDCHQRAVEMTENLLGPDHVEVANFYNNLGAVYFKRSELDLAKDCCQQALEIREKQLGPNHADVAYSCHNLGNVYREMCELDLAKDCYERALEIQGDQLVPYHVDFVNSYDDLGVLYCNEGKLHLAKNCHQRALEIREKHLIPNHVDIATSCNNLGAVYCEEGNLDLAQNFHQRALEIREKHLAPNHVAIATSCSNLGVVYCEEGNIDLAKKFHQQALEIRKEQFGSNHVDVANSYNNLGAVYFKEGNLELAKKFHERALEIRKKEFGLNHVDVANSYSNLGAVYCKYGNLELAKNVHERALEIRKKQFGSNHVDVANSYHNLGVVYIEKGVIDLAKDCLHRALDIKEQQFGPNHVNVATTCSHLGFVYYKKGEFDLAKDFWQRALKIQEKRLAPNYVDVANSYHKLGVVYIEKDELDLAKDCHQQALEFRQKQFGQNHLDVANSYYHLGLVYHKKEELDLAEDCHHRALQIREKQFGRNHVDVAHSYYNLGMVYHKKGELDLAKNCHRRVLEIQTILVFLNLMTS